MNSIIKYLLLFMASIALMTVALVGVASIPRDHIQKKSEESAEQLIKRDTAYYNLIGGASGRALLRPWDCSKIDQTADSYLLSIAYYLNEDHPLESVLLLTFSCYTSHAHFFGLIFGFRFVFGFFLCFFHCFSLGSEYGIKFFTSA